MMSASLRRSRAIACLAAHDCEGDARHFIGERDGDKFERLGLQELLRPGSQRVFVRFAMIEDRMRADDEQFPQISIPFARHSTKLRFTEPLTRFAHLRDAAQSLLASGRVLFWR